MQLTTITAILAGAASVAASPVLSARTDFGSCPVPSQYYCSTLGLVNVLTCTSILNGNVIKIPISIGVKRSAEPEAQPEPEVEKRTDYPPPYPYPQPPNTDGYCCTTTGLVNILTCTNLLNGNTVSAPISVVIGWL